MPEPFGAIPRYLRHKFGRAKATIDEPFMRDLAEHLHGPVAVIPGFTSTSAVVTPINASGTNLTGIKLVNTGGSGSTSWSVQWEE